MSFSDPFIRRPIATLMVMIALALLGKLGFDRLPVAPLPEVEYPTLEVRTAYPGADPRLVEALITAPLEKQLAQISGLKRLSSSSGYGRSVITLSFELGLDLDVADQQIQSALYNASTLLPQDLPTPPMAYKSNPDDAPVLALALSAERLSPSQLQDLAEMRLIQRLSQVSGVGVVDSPQGLRTAIHIQLDPHRLAAAGLGLETVRTKLQELSLNQPKGSFDGSRLARVIDANDQLLTVDEFRAQILSYSAQSPLRLGEVATLVEGPENPDEFLWVDGRPAIILWVHRQPGANTLEVVSDIRKRLPELLEGLPADVRLEILEDRSLSIRASVAQIEHELLLTTALVIAVLFVFLRRPGATLIPALSIPLSLAGTFALMKVFGFSLNNLSLMALTIATGFVVDDAIVMLENIVRHVESGLSPLQAARRGAREIGFTILALTLALLATLIPLLFMPDLLGRLFREFALTLAIAISVSALVALTLTPMLVARIPLGKPREASIDSALMIRYQRSLHRLLDRPGRIHLGFLLTVALTGLLAWTLPKGFFPIQDTGLIAGISRADPRLGFETLKHQQQSLAERLREDPAVAHVALEIGIEGSHTLLSEARLWLVLKPEDQRDSAEKVIARLQQRAAAEPLLQLSLSSVQDLSLGASLGTTPLFFAIEGLDEGPDTEKVDELLAALGKRPELRAVSRDSAGQAEVLALSIDRDTLARLGLSSRTLMKTLSDAFGRPQVLNRYTPSSQSRVILEVAPPFRTGPDSLNTLYLPAPNGGQIPLGSLVRRSIETGPLAITRVSQRPAVHIGFELAPGRSLDEAVIAIDAVMTDFSAKSPIDLQRLGIVDAFARAFEDEGPLLLAAIVAVYLLLGILYESFVHPLTILSTLPSAALGGLLMLGILGQTLDIVALIGFILLIGIVAKNAIMMIDFALVRQRRSGISARAAIEEAAVLRFRPILMTSLAAFFAGLPLALGGGSGAELREPLGIVMLGGLLVSQLLTLYTTPAIYLAFDRLRSRFNPRASSNPWTSGKDPA